MQDIIDYGKYPKLQRTGENKGDKVEIFTPYFVVKDMVGMIGNSYVCDINKTILEPASGDGAFTVYILDLRLKSLITDKDNYLQKSLMALSTIFSIEMNEKLIEKQRNNIYSLLCFVARETNIRLTPKYHKLAKEIITTNFIWGETNIKNKIQPNLLGVEIGWYMPKAETPKAIKFARYKINKDLSYSVTMEQGEIGE